jgi:hypothetical protein
LIVRALSPADGSASGGRSEPEGTQEELAQGFFSAMKEMLG